MAIETYGGMKPAAPEVHGDLITPAKGSVDDPMFWKWLMKLDIVASDYHYYHCSIVEHTGIDCWVDYYLDEFSPEGALIEDWLCGL